MTSHEWNRQSRCRGCCRSTRIAWIGVWLLISATFLRHVVVQTVFLERRINFLVVHSISICHVSFDSLHTFQMMKATALSSLVGRSSPKLSKHAKMELWDFTLLAKRARKLRIRLRRRLHLQWTRRLHVQRTTWVAKNPPRYRVRFITQAHSVDFFRELSTRTWSATYAMPKWSEHDTGACSASTTICARIVKELVLWLLVKIGVGLVGPNKCKISS